ncbi:cordon-bleu protein-like 1b isoform 2-T2 [Pholidichthys leucotaenia]
MEVGSCAQEQLQRSCPAEFVKPVSLVMDDRGSQSHPRSSGLRVSTKNKAPSPPGLKDTPGLSQWYAGNPHLTMDQKENLIDKELSLSVVLPGGVEKMTVVHGSKPLMDLLVTLCATYHLNPSNHTLELVTAKRNNIKLKPNALIGTLDAEKIIIKPKGEDKNKKLGPQMPEATVRMVINYKKTQKTILRVNPRVPLAELLPAICEKCEFDLETTVLLRDVHSLAPLDLSSSLNDYAIREVYAKDTKGQLSSPVSLPSPTYSGPVSPGKDKTQKEKENKGLFSMFRRSKKKSEQTTTASAPASPVLVSKPRPLSMALPSSDSSPLDSPTYCDGAKKRRAPQPPIQVSQRCTTDAGARRRLYSEPNTRLDGDQMAGVSLGSSAESSLKRTKRKAPPPPTSPSPVVQKSVSPDENLQAAAANTLEEIMEQEETTAPVISATASNAQGEDGNLSVSTDVLLQSPSPNTEKWNTMSVEGSGEDLTFNLSSDGDRLQSTLNNSATVNGRESDGTDLTVLGNTGNIAVGVERVNQQPMSEAPTHGNTQSDLSTAPSSPPPPLMQDTEAQASVQTNTESLAGEDAEVQTDFTRLPATPQPHKDKGPSSAEAPACKSPGKKDMATLTEELGAPDLEHALSQTSEASSHKDLTPSVPPATKVPSVYATDSEPKPKPSNELTRDYIPKVGMTTYTIVPQKSLEKLRYFEVALTLEAPTEAQEEEIDIDSLHLNERVQTEVSENKGEPHTTLHREDVLNSSSTSTTTAPIQHTVDGRGHESTHSSSPSLGNTDSTSSSATGASQAGSPVEVKETKIPPATKPKPASFRLPQHKKTPGYYVTSAAEKCLNASPGSGLKEAQGSAERAKSPTPLLLQCQEESTEAANVPLSPKQTDKDVSVMRITRQTSLPSRDRSTGLSLDKLRSFAAPRPYSPSTPSRFAQAVSSAVKRSQSLSHRPKSPPFTVSPPVSPIMSPSPVMDSRGLSKIKDYEDRDVDGDDAILQRKENEPSCANEIVQTSGESSP